MQTTLESASVLIVEDEFLIALDIKEILEENGYHVLSIVTNYNDAVNLIKHRTPALVIIDVKLKHSVKDGIDLGNYLLNKNIVPFIYITSIEDKYSLNRIVESRPNGFIAKPYKKIDILTSVQIALNKFKHRNIDYNTIKNPIEIENPYLIKNVINYITTHMDKKIELDELVRLTRWKKHHFIRIFTSYVGVTPYNYIITIKIEHAKLLLSDEKNKLDEIAYNLGFQSYINFSRTFKKHTKQSPNQYRINNCIINKYLK